MSSPRNDFMWNANEELQIGPHATKLHGLNQPYKEDSVKLSERVDWRPWQENKAIIERWLFWRVGCLWRVTSDLCPAAFGVTSLRCYLLVCYQDPSEYRNVRHFHFLHWPEDGNPWSGQTILQLICKVDSWEKEVRVYAKPFEVIGPIVVHCKWVRMKWKELTL